MPIALATGKNTGKNKASHGIEFELTSALFHLTTIYQAGMSTARGPDLRTG
jgi:hypothetical protein